MLKKVATVVVPVFVALLVAQQVMRGNPVQHLDVNDEESIRRAFFPRNGEVWAIACETSAEHSIPEYFEAVASRLSDEIKFAAMDCKAKLPGGSGRNTMQRWKLKASEKPVIFVANGAQTTQIPTTRSEYDLVRELRLAAARRPLQVRNDETFKERCLSKPRCVLMLLGGTLEAAHLKTLDKVAGDFAGEVSLASVDAAEWRLNIEGFEAGDKAKLRNYEAGAHRLIYLRNDTGTTIKALAPKSIASLGQFLAGVTDDNLVPLLDDDQNPMPISLIKRPKNKPPPRKKAPPPPPPPETPKTPETLSPEEREKIRRDREAKRRDQMEREAANSAFVAEEADEDDDGQPQQEEEEEEIIEEI